MTTPLNGKLEVLADPEAVADRVAHWMRELIATKAGNVAVCLSGGSTPQRLYQLLAGPPYRDSFPWSRMHLFWGDERFVPYADARSNYGMARKALLSRAPVPVANIHPIPSDAASPKEVAARYERTLQTYYGETRLDPARPLFDVTLLGLGLDGHTASLFPLAPALSERERWVVAVPGPAHDIRVTMTYPPLESSRYVAFLIEGEDKRAIFNRLRRGDAALPAARLRPTGELIWFVDRAAAGTAA